MWRYLLVCIFLSTYSYAQDTIKLDELKVNKTYKKPKMKTFLVGNHKDEIHIDITLRLGDSYYSLVETHFGEVKQLKLIFGTSAAYKPDGSDNFASHVFDTEYAITLYRNNNGRPGAIINTEPIKVMFEASNRLKSSEEIDVSRLNIVDNSFFIRFTRLTKPIDKEKSYYVPIVSDSAKACFFQAGRNQGEIVVLGANRTLIVEVKMLTQDY